MIEINNLVKKYKKEETNALNIQNLKLPNRGLIAFFGRSGCGKTTLFNILAGIIKPTSGEVLIDGKNIDGYNYNVGYVFQDYNLILNLSVYENIVKYLKIRGINKNDDEINDALRSLDLYELRNKCVSRLSGGQKQRVSIARVILSDLKIIILDEPTSSLDSYNSKIILDSLKLASKNALILLSCHNMDLVKEYSDIIYEMKNGVIENKIIINECDDFNINDYKIVEYNNPFKKVELIRNEFKNIIKIKGIILNIILNILIILSIFFGLVLVNYIEPSGKMLDKYDNNLMCVVVRSVDEENKLLEMKDKNGIDNIYVSSIYINDGTNHNFKTNSVFDDMKSLYLIDEPISNASSYNLIAGKKDIHNYEVVITKKVADMIIDSIDIDYYDSYEKFIGMRVDEIYVIKGIVDSDSSALYFEDIKVCINAKFDDTFSTNKITAKNGFIDIKKSYMVHTTNYKETKKALLNDFSEDYVLTYESYHDAFKEYNLDYNSDNITKYIVFLSVTIASICLIELIRLFERRYYEKNLYKIGVKNKTLIMNNLIGNLISVVLFGMISSIIGGIVFNIIRINDNSKIFVSATDMYIYPIITLFILTAIIRYIIIIFSSIRNK